jgi:serine/threonine-protein kinase
MRPGSTREHSDAIASAYDTYLQGRGYLQRFDKPGNLDRAITLFQAVIQADPKFALGYASLGEAYWDRYRQDQNPDWLKNATDYCDRAIALNKNLPAVFTIAARIHADTGHNDMALAEFDQALKLDPRNADARLGRASVYERLGRIKEAENEFRAAVELRPEYWVGVSELGSFYFRQHRTDDAAREFRREVELVPDSANAHSNYGAMLSRLGKPDEAIVELRKSLAISETYPAYANLGILYYRQKDWANSALMTEKALSINPNDYRVWGNLGIAYEQMGNSAKAAEAYKQEFVHLSEIAKVKGDMPSVQSDLAVLYSKNKDRENALAHLQAALSRSPDDPQILADSAEVYENLGDHSRAVTQAQKSLANGWTMDKLAENPGLRSVISDPRFHHR